jgi:hypothetical protein
VLAFGAAGCGVPMLEVGADAPAGLFVDGVAAGPAPLARTLPYFGTIQATAVAPFDPRAARREVTAWIEADPPAPLWLFPFDFLIEGTRSLFAGSPVYRAALDLPEPAPTVVEGVPPPWLGELTVRAAAIARER